jgi:KDO2-lipid IV(A) lauroyltransferase
MKDILIWTYWYPFRFLVQGMPLGWAYLLARALGGLMYRFSRRRKEAIGRELRDLPDRSPGDADFEKAVSEAFRVFVFNEVEVMLYPRLNRGNIHSVVRFSGLQNLDRALEGGKGAMLLFAHFGSNQMIMPAVGYSGYNMCQLSAPATVWKDVLKSKRFSPIEEKALQIRWALELSLPVRHINIFGSLKEAFKCLGRNEVLGVAVDGGGGRDRVEVDFLGRRALFSAGAMEIAIRTGCAVLPTFMLRDEKGTNTLLIEPPLLMGRDGDPADFVRSALQRFVEELEKFVLKYPGHYLNYLSLRRFMADQGDSPFFLDGK